MTPECILFVNVQKRKFINLCVLIRELVPDVTFDNFRWNYHCIKRADKELRHLMDQNGEIGPNKKAEFKAILENTLICQLDSMATVDGI